MYKEIKIRKNKYFYILKFYFSSLVFIYVITEMFNFVINHHRH